MKKHSDVEAAGITRRGLLTSAAAVGVVPMAMSGTADAAVKVSKASVGFQETAKGGHSCGNCRQFAAPDACNFVAGAVSTGCCCKIWTGKAA